MLRYLITARGVTPTDPFRSGLQVWFERACRLAAAGCALWVGSSAGGAPVASPDQLHAVGGGANAQVANLTYAAAPVDNPLKGFVPYQDQSGRLLFPHSMSFEYLALRDLMTGPAAFNWSPLEQWLNSAAGEGCQLTLRVYVDFPSRTTGIPQYLLNSGLITRGYADYGNTNSVAPDYTNPNLQAALTNFIAALGQRYDGDPRIGFIEVGLLGFWGEWHNGTGTMAQYFASTAVQQEVINAYVGAFHKTKLLMRTPGSLNVNLPFGYHDDSFAYTTVAPPAWYTTGLMQAAGSPAVNKWRTQPFGGEVRPELWYCIWNNPSCAPSGQDFNTCLNATHASWLMNTGVFDASLVGDARTRALAGARALGYEFQVLSLAAWVSGAGLSATVRIQNTGVAPFYYDWPVELAAATPGGQILATWRTSWRVSSIMPGAVPQDFVQILPNPPSGGFVLLMQAVNPLAGGKSLRFANTSQDQTLAGWLTLGSIP